MSRRKLIIGLIIALVLTAFTISVNVAVNLRSYVIGVHQKGVIRELAELKGEYGVIKSRHDAVRTAGMLGYVQHYYIPSDGYHSTPEIEEALESQRHETIESFVRALRDFTNKDFGADSERWLAFLKNSDG